MTAERLWLLVSVYSLITGSLSFDNFSFSVTPADLVVERHGSVLWNCSAEGEEPISYSWYFEGATINDTERRVLENGSLHILSIWPRRDTGNYRCCASNPLGVLCSASLSLSVANLPQFSLNPVSINVTAGSTARFSCHTEGTPTPVIIWKKDRKVLDMTGLNNPRYTVLPGGVLQIDNVTQQDGGEFKCQASNILRSRNSSPASLQVLPPFEGPLPEVPEIVAPPQHVTKKVGEYAVLECLANHPEYEISWSKQGNEPIRTDAVNYIGRHNLFFFNLQPEDAGTYICTVTNKETALSVLSKARLTVHEAPRIVKTDLNDIIGITVGSIARFSCRVTGIPKPTVSWYFRGEPLVTRDRTSIQDNNDLVINRVRVTDRGIYQCMVTSAAGSDVASAFLDPAEVDNEPNAPRFLRVNYTTSTTIKVVWDLPAVVNNLVAFSIHYKEQDGSEAALPVDKTAQSFILENLKPFTNYQIYAVSWRSNGPSPPSNSVFPQTKEDVPSVAPDFFVHSSSQDTIRVVWSEMDPSSKNGIIVEYIIAYTEVEENENEVVSVTGDMMQYVISNLEANTYYKIRMAASTSAGRGPFSAWVDVHTLDSSEDSSLPAPVVDVSALNHTAIEITINLIDEYEDIVGFKVAVIDDAGDTIKDLLIPADSLVFPVGGLIPDTTYKVHVQVYNDEEDGHIASGTVATHSQPICSNGFPSQFNLSTTSPRSILVTWQQSITDSPIEGYTIRYSTALSNSTMVDIAYKARSGDRPPYFLEIGDLEPFTYYRVEIRVHIPNCSGVFGSSKYMQTMQDLPSSVAEVVADPLDPYSIRLTWQSPERPNGVITYYVIMYNDNPGVPDNVWFRVQQNASHERSIVTNLKSNTAYYFKVQACTQAGEGPPTNPPVMAKTPVEVPDQSVWGDEQQIGILIGVAMALVCIVICCTFLLLRFRTPARVKSRLSIVSAEEEPPYVGSFICRGKCHGADGTYVIDRVGGEDELEAFRPMLTSHNVVLSSSQGLHLNARLTYPAVETLNLDSDLSNHSASSGFVDSSYQAEQLPADRDSGEFVRPEAVPLCIGDATPPQVITQEYTDQSHETAFIQMVPSGLENSKKHSRYTDPETNGRSIETEAEVPLVEKMLRSTVPSETQV